MKVPYQKVHVDPGADFVTTAGIRLIPATGTPEYAIGFGPCPRCTDQVEVHERILVLDFYGSRDYHYRQYCNCEGNHRGCPTGQKGCGAWWPVKLTWTESDGH